MEKKNLDELIKIALNEIGENFATIEAKKRALRSEIDFLRKSLVDKQKELSNMR